MVGTMTRPVAFGLNVDPNTGGLEYVGIQDHPYNPDLVDTLTHLIAPESRDMFHGPAERWIETLTTLYRDSGMNTFVFWPSGDRSASPAFSPRRSSPPCAKRWSAACRPDQPTHASVDQLLRSVPTVT